MQRSRRDRSFGVSRFFQERPVGGPASLHLFTDSGPVAGMDVADLLELRVRKSQLFGNFSSVKANAKSVSWTSISNIRRFWSRRDPERLLHVVVIGCDAEYPGWGCTGLYGPRRATNTAPAENSLPAENLGPINRRPPQPPEPFPLHSVRTAKDFSSHSSFVFCSRSPFAASSFAAALIPRFAPISFRFSFHSSLTFCTY